jgi:hypothetical protein
MAHLTRVGLLVFLFVNAVLLARATSTVVSVEQLGITHGDNPREWAALPVVNQDAAVCAECHEPVNASWQIGDHAVVTCENCHGATKEHIEGARNGLEASLALPDARDLCLFCHAELAARPSDFPQVEVATHGGTGEIQQARCTSCHNPHHPGIPSAIPHEVKLPPGCLDCHAKGRWVPVSDAHEGLTNRDCLTCHIPEEEFK